tara:strand:- start:16857 stop:17000 length:144 start_codon:yes stop_codon:yes gene_type:complete
VTLAAQGIEVGRVKPAFRSITQWLDVVDELGRLQVTAPQVLLAEMVD